MKKENHENTFLANTSSLKAVATIHAIDCGRTLFSFTITICFEILTFLEFEKRRTALVSDLPESAMRTRETIKKD